MKRRILIICTGIVLLFSLTACAKNHEGVKYAVMEKESSIPKSAALTSVSKKVVNTAIEGNLSIEQRNGEYTFLYTVKNQSEIENTIQFNSSLPYDYSIKNSKGEKVFQYSDGKLFTMKGKLKNMQPDEEINYNGKLTDLAKGKYVIEFFTTDKNHLARATKEINVI